jgi:tRNA nucleotidyltransferase (CCA-adding enzyme)
MKSYILSDLKRQVLARIKPTPQDREKIESHLKPILERINGMEYMIQGSFAKDTWLKGSSDVDVFILFDKESKNRMEEIVNELESKMSGYQTEKAYAEHPYLIVKDGFIEVDLVPAVKVESGDQIVTAVDRTPFHTRFVNSRLSDQQKDEVRVLKQFMKGIGVYGAEIKVMGFSGYICELLVANYGSFENVVEEASKWKPQVRIDLMGESKKNFDEPLVIVDPVDPKRNAAAAVSMKSLATFSFASKLFIEKPSLNFFFPPEVEGEPLGDIMIVEIKIEENLAKDVIWGQVVKTVERIRKELSNAGFRIIDVGAWEEGNIINIGIELEERKIGKYYKSQGPPFFIEGSLDFAKKNQYVWIGEDGRLYSVKERRFTDPEEIVKLSISIKVKHEINVKWMKEKGRGEVGSFMRKTPPWLR